MSRVTCISKQIPGISRVQEKIKARKKSQDEQSIKDKRD
jgi:hypothetical protein